MFRNTEMTRLDHFSLEDNNHLSFINMSAGILETQGATVFTGIMLYYIITMIRIIINTLQLWLPNFSGISQV